MREGSQARLPDRSRALLALVLPLVLAACSGDKDGPSS
jgi:hypothetical protein